MKYSEYEEEVRKIYPDAKELDNETDDLWANLWWISDGHGNDISDDVELYKNAWQNAYNRIKQKTKITNHD